jgi:hypothetical protein
MEVMEKMMMMKRVLRQQHLIIIMFSRDTAELVLDLAVDNLRTFVFSEKYFNRQGTPHHD